MRLPSRAGGAARCHPSSLARPRIALPRLAALRVAAMRLLVVLGAALVLPAAARAQAVAPPRGESRLPPDADSVAPPPTTFPDGTRRVEGRVMRGEAREARPLAGTWVTLHRVAADFAGPLDSVRTDAEGGYRFRFRPAGSDDAIYFASTSYGGVAYFTRPLREPLTRGDDAEMLVFDTTSRALPVAVRGRHVVVAPADSAGRRTVVEVYELSNDTSVTMVAGDSARGVWSVRVPAAARELTAVRGDVPPEAIVHRNGRAVLLAPFAPGLKQVGFSYKLDEDAFPLQIAIERPTNVLEVLLADPRGSATGARLAAVAPASLDGQQYQRFLAQDVRDGATVTVSVSRGGLRPERVIVPALLALLGGGMLVALLRSTSRRGATAPTSPAAPVAPPGAPLAPADERARLAREIAALDDAFARDTAPGDDARQAYERRRAELKAALARALAGADRDR